MFENVDEVCDNLAMLVALFDNQSGGYGNKTAALMKIAALAAGNYNAGVECITRICDYAPRNA